ncbi:MAG: 3'-5' exoribonuclease [Gammaproteobacteria bacterium]|nr:3'-5' exoribonuclease [Gammaproteobacteria bacterium]MBU1654086.1 3'-5' exoribonuclease [Gammaproteobacteria bacterium]MBU1961367.1 3'-5' exoribonuclease [Gammaproteobacteria bacterium]
MRYWFDTEFHDDGRHLALISIGVVAEDGREYYAVSSDYDPDRATDWLVRNVLPQLGDVEKKSRQLIRQELQAFFAEGARPEFWADCGEYDWIILRQLFGTLTDWPEGWPFLAMDVEQWRIQSGAPPFPPQQTGHHNALADARHTRGCWQWLAAWAKGESPC